MSCTVRGAGKTQDRLQELNKFQTKRTALGEESNIIKTLIQVTAFALGELQSPKNPSKGQHQLRAQL